ncbi:hypothetical protein ACXYMU_00630 [Pontibacter sp. CAU 1760]
MRNKLLLLTLLLCFCQLAKAQTQDSSFYRHSLGVTVNPIYDADGFTAKHPTALGLMYRYQYKENKAIRLGASGAYDQRTYLTTLNSNPVPQDTLLTTKFLELSIGHEWQYKIGSFFTFGQGIDLAPFLINRLYKIDNILIGENRLINEQIKREYKTTGLALQPFINISISLLPRLFLVAECKATVEYSKQRYSAVGTYGDVNESHKDRGTISGGAERERFTTSIKPISSLQLNFKL